jgi:ABC-type uncharacterized transport system substrate-binding protein
MDLDEWSTHYIKFKDCMKKNILEIKQEKHTIIVTEKNRTIHYHMHNTLKEGIEQLNQKQPEVIITYNSKNNLQTLIDMWRSIQNNKELTIIFANTKTNQKWLIHPYTHSNISEDKKLKEGLKTLFESISEV